MTARAIVTSTIAKAWRGAVALTAIALTAATPAARGRTAIGAYGDWGAFRDAAPARCFAIARPVIAGRRSGGFASVASWSASGPGRGLRQSFYARLGRPRDRSAPVTLSIGDRRFVLAAGDRDAWATDAPSDRAIVDAMRSGRSMSIEGVAPGGAPFAEVYRLAGAATAIDAATLACAR